MDWREIGFRLEDTWSRWWWLYVMVGTIVVPLCLHLLGFGGGVSDECVRFSSIAESC